MGKAQVAGKDTGRTADPTWPKGLQPLDESAQENVYPEMSIAMEMSTLEQTHLEASVAMQKPVLSTPCSICVCGQSHARILQSICGCG